MGRTVLLRHDLPDGSWHFDWMIQPGPGAPLITFRVGARIDSGALPRFTAERLADHREAYLDYQGPVTGGRGTVTRVADGELAVVRDGEGQFVCRGRLGHAAGTFAGRREADGWRFEFRGER